MGREAPRQKKIQKGREAPRKNKHFQGLNTIFRSFSKVFLWFEKIPMVLLKFPWFLGPEKIPWFFIRRFSGGESHHDSEASILAHRLHFPCDVRLRERLGRQVAGRFPKCCPNKFASSTRFPNALRISGPQRVRHASK